MCTISIRCDNAIRQDIYSYITIILTKFKTIFLCFAHTIGTIRNLYIILSHLISFLINNIYVTSTDAQRYIIYLK